MGATLRKSHFAASIGVQRQRITELMKRGFPVRPDGWVDVDEATEWMRANVSQQARFADRGIHKILGEAAKPRNSKRAAPLTGGIGQGQPRSAGRSSARRWNGGLALCSSESTARDVSSSKG